MLLFMMNISSQTFLITNLLVYSMHFGSSLLNQCIIASMVLQRYNKFKRENIAEISLSSAKYIIFAIGFGTTALCIIILDIWRSIESKIFQNKPRTSFISVIIITIIISSGNIIISFTSRKICHLIRAADERANRILNIRRTTDTARVRATTRLIVCFISEWIPYGLARLSGFITDDRMMFDSINRIAHMLSILIYITIPMIYYKMDGQFYSYVKNLFKVISNDNEVEHN